MADDKPLPSLPAGSNLVTLSVEARNQRAALIGHFLKDLNEPGIESRRDRWLKVFEDVLDNLGKHIHNEGWLNGIKRGTEFKRLAGSRTPTTASQNATESQHLNGANVAESSGKAKGKEDNDTDVPSFPLQQLRILAAAPAPPPGQPHVSHLVLCLEPHGTQPPSLTEDQGFSIVPANVGCTFSVGNFLLPHSNRQDDAGSIMFGLDSLEVDMWGATLRLVGGTFTFKSVTALQHQLLSKVLKLAIYTHFSLILEQNILSDSSVQLTLTRPKVPRISSSTPATAAADTTPPQAVGLRAKYSIFPSSFTNFLSRHNLRYRGAETVGEVGSRRSIDLVHFPSQQAEVPPSNLSPESPHEGHFGGRLHRLSFIGDKRLSFLRGHHREPSTERKVSIRPHPFANALRRVEDSRGFLSTSVGVNIPLPKILTDLAEKERTIVSQSEAQDQKPVQKLRADEKAALLSLLGWDGKDAEGRGMSGILGFLRQQEISVLITHYPVISTEAQQRTPSASGFSSVSGYSTIQNTSTFTRSGETSSTIMNPSHFQTKFRPCGKPSWVTYRYYSCSSGEDFLLGDWVMDMAKRRHEPCSAKAGCGITEGQHEKRIIHDGVRIVVKVADLDNGGEKSEEGEKGPVALIVAEDQIFVWESCVICGAKTSQKLMSTGSLLFSYAKYLELLIYSPLVCSLTPALCEHTTPPPPPLSTLPSSRFNIVRHFTTPLADISFSLSPIEEVFELRMPLLQIIRGVDKAASPFTEIEVSSNADGPSSEKKELRRQIRTWWEGVSDHLDKIEQALSVDSHPLQKALPRLPSGDDAYDVFGAEENETAPGSTTPTPLTPVPLPVPPTSPQTPSESLPDASYFSTVPNASSDPQPPKRPIVPSKDDSVRLLTSLRHNFHNTERSLYSHLAKTPDTSLNDIRRAFLFAGKGTQKRLKAWQHKHLGSAKSKVVGDLDVSEPEWWGKGCHVVPNSNVIVREGDWGSIIAHTLSTVDYQLEMAQLSSTPSGLHANRTASSSSAPSTSSTFFSLNTGYRLFTSSKIQPDPDQEDIIWNEPEQYSATISRKERGRDGTGLPLIRDVLGRKVTPGQLAGDGISTGSNGVSSGPPKAHANIAINAEAVGGVVSAADETQKADKLLHEYDEATPTASRQETPKPEPISTTDPVVDYIIEEERRPSTISNQSEHDAKKGLDAPALDTKSIPPALPAKDDVAIGQVGVATLTDPIPQPTPLPNSSSGFSMSFTAGINSAMKYLGAAESPSRLLVRGLSNTRKPGSHPTDTHPIDDRPHIRYDWTMGKRVKFSCTAYYAKQFELLRKKCGIHENFVTSLSKSTNWAAEGGKSKSNFWKTSDDRFIVKTLVNAWNVADLQVLIDHAPSYFQYMDATASKPTVLAKLMGFYTVEIKNLETGVVQAKTDLLVMENLFYGRNVLKQFDLKGIQGRKVKTPGNASKTLFDGEWIEGQQRTLTLVRPHSKLLLQDAIRNDVEFLSKSNIMDYSLLLGLDEEKKEIACGLVDTIGSYTFAKTLEYKAKHGLQTGKEVTVMPPAEYQERFVKTLGGYFVACPDKWSKPLDESKAINDTTLLPSVL